jgi:Zn-dependent peptidase ImmA (M78 family)
LNGKRAIIQLSFRGKTDDHFWFSFFHEAGHVLQMKIKSVVIHSDEEKNISEEEQAANHFATNVLIRRKHLINF